MNKRIHHRSVADRSLLNISYEDLTEKSFLKEKHIEEIIEKK